MGVVQPACNIHEESLEDYKENAELGEDQAVGCLGKEPESELSTRHAKKPQSPSKVGN